MLFAQTHTLLACDAVGAATRTIALLSICAPDISRARTEQLEKGEWRTACCDRLFSSYVGLAIASLQRSRCLMVIVPAALPRTASCVTHKHSV